MIPIIILSAIGTVFSFSKMKKFGKKEQIVKDVFSLCVWVIAVIAADIYVEATYKASGLEAMKYMTSWEVILMFIGAIVVNKLFNLFYTRGDDSV
jgi:hypothetical protein